MLWGSVTIGQDALGYGADWSGCPGVWCRSGCSEVRCLLVRMLWGTVPIGQDVVWCRLVMLWGTVLIGQDALVR